MDNSNRCPRCWENYQLDVRPRPISIKKHVENGEEITNYKYVCSCGCSWERTERVKEDKSCEQKRTQTSTTVSG